MLFASSPSLFPSILFYSLLFFLSFSRLCMAANWAVSLAYAVAFLSARQTPDRLLKAHYCEVLRGRARNFSSPLADSSLMTTATLTLSRLSSLSPSPIFSIYFRFFSPCGPHTYIRNIYLYLSFACPPIFGTHLPIVAHVKYDLERAKRQLIERDSGGLARRAITNVGNPVFRYLTAKVNRFSVSS